MSTKKIDSVKKIISRFMSVYGLHKPKEAADELGVSSQVLNNWIARDSHAAIEKIKEIVEEAKIDFVLYGEEEKSPSTPEGERASKIVSGFEESTRLRLVAMLLEEAERLMKQH